MQAPWNPHPLTDKSSVPLPLSVCLGNIPPPTIILGYGKVCGDMTDLFSYIIQVAVSTLVYFPLTQILPRKRKRTLDFFKPVRNTGSSLLSHPGLDHRWGVLQGTFLNITLCSSSPCFSCDWSLHLKSLLLLFCSKCWMVWLYIYIPESITYVLGVLSPLHSVWLFLFQGRNHRTFKLFAKSGEGL